jgi:hypothetical protein
MDDSTLKKEKRIRFIFRITNVILLIGNIGFIIYSIIITILKNYFIGIMMTGLIILYICYFY